jgi:uncharacterized UBP type Zn finger protein
MMFNFDFSSINCYIKDESEEPTKGFEFNQTTLDNLLSMGVSPKIAQMALFETKNGELDQIFEYIEQHCAKDSPEKEKRQKKQKPRQIPLELQHLFAQLSLVDKMHISTKELTTKGFEWQNFDGQVQHDAHDLNRSLPPQPPPPHPPSSI